MYGAWVQWVRYGFTYPLDESHELRVVGPPLRELVARHFRGRCVKVEWRNFLVVEG